MNKKSVLLSFVLLVVVMMTILALLYWLAPDSFVPKYAKAAATRDEWAELTGKDAQLEARIALLETRISLLESKTCSCQQTGQAVDLSGFSQRISTLESESTQQKSLLDSIYQMLLKLFTLLTQVLSKLK